MRINVYNEELTDEVQIVTVEPAPGRKYIGGRFMLKSPKNLHHTDTDDDRSAVTFWLGTPEAARVFLQRAIAVMERR